MCWFPAWRSEGIVRIAAERNEPGRKLRKPMWMKSLWP